MKSKKTLVNNLISKFLTLKNVLVLMFFRSTSNMGQKLDHFFTSKTYLVYTLEATLLANSTVFGIARVLFFDDDVPCVCQKDETQLCIFSNTMIIRFL